MGRDREDKYLELILTSASQTLDWCNHQLVWLVLYLAIAAVPTSSSNDRLKMTPVSEKDRKPVASTAKVALEINSVLSQEVLVHYVLSFLNVTDLLILQGVCQMWKKQCQSILKFNFPSKKAFKSNEELRTAVRKLYRTGTDPEWRPDTKDVDEIAVTYGYPMGRWNVARLRDFSMIFYRCETFNEYIGSWDMSRAKNTRYMFCAATLFNQPLNSWDVQKVQTMNYMFCGASSFNQPLGLWNTIQVERMQGMFEGATAFNQDLSSWNTSQVWDMSWMFQDATAFNQDLASWNTSEVTDMSNMFRRASAFDQDLSSWNCSNVRLATIMLSGATSFTHIESLPEELDRETVLQ